MGKERITPNVGNTGYLFTMMNYQSLESIPTFREDKSNRLTETPYTKR